MPLAGLLGDLKHAHALLLRPVEIRIPWQAHFGTGVDKGAGERVDATQVGYIQRAPGAVVFGSAAFLILRFLEIWQYFGIAPSGVAEPAPEIVVVPVTANIDHGVDRARPAQHFAARPVHSAVVETWLLFGVIGPIVRGLEQLRKRRGNRSEEHTSELQSLRHLVCRLLLEKKKKQREQI